jgi:hypothetical protein
MSKQVEEHRKRIKRELAKREREHREYSRREMESDDFGGGEKCICGGGLYGMERAYANAYRPGHFPGPITYAAVLMPNGEYAVEYYRSDGRTGILEQRFTSMKMAKMWAQEKNEIDAERRK